MLVLLLVGGKNKISVWEMRKIITPKSKGLTYCFSIFNLVPNFVVARLTEKGGWCLSGIDNQENKPDVRYQVGCSPWYLTTLTRSQWAIFQQSHRK